MSESATIAANPDVVQPDSTRKDGGKLGERPNKLQVKIRIHFCFARLSQGEKWWKVRNAFCKKYGVCKRTAMRYVSWAREEVAKQIEIPLVDLKNESLAMYRQISIDPAASRSERLAARKALDDLMGIRSPREHIITGRGKGGAVAVENRTPQLVINVVQVSPAAIASPGLPAVSEPTGLPAASGSSEPVEQLIPAAASEPAEPLSNGRK
jgi:hypothetical protein